MPSHYRLLLGLLSILISLWAVTSWWEQPGVYPVGDDRPLVVGVHDLALREGVTEEQFEAFVAGPLREAFREPVNGVSVGVSKCDRGESVGQYQMGWFLESVAQRDSYFPEGGEATDLYEEEVGQHVGEIMSQLFSLCQSTGFTDYVVVFATPDPSEGQVPALYGSHKLELRDGVTEGAFEEFITGDYAKAWSKEIKGCGNIILKGDRGERAGKYTIVHRFRPWTLRDQYIPEPSRLSEEWTNEVEPLLPEEAGNRLREMAGRDGFSDWGPILPKE